MAALTLAPILGRTLSRELRVSNDTTDQRIMDALVAELRVTPLRKLSLEDVAERAGVTRMTIYRRFDNRERLIETTVAREVAAFLTSVAESDEPDSSPTDRIADEFATALQLARSHPVVAHWLATSPGDLLNLILADDGFVIAAGSAFLTAKIEELMPGRNDTRDANRTGELLARLFASLVLMPPKAVDLSDPDQARALARELIAPLVVAEAEGAERV